MIDFFKKNKIIIILILISFLSHWYIFFDFKILNAGDWTFHFDSQMDNLTDYHIYYGTANLGLASCFANNWIFYLLYSLLNLFGLSWDIGTRILFLIPLVFLTPVFSFLCFRKIFNKDVLAFFATSLYCFNTFFLKLQLDFLTYAFIWWILPAMFWLIIKYFEKQKKKYLFCLIILTLLGVAYELRITILVLVYLSLFQIFYFLFFKDKWLKKIKIQISIFASYILGIMGHLFWIIPLKLVLYNNIMSVASPTPFTAYYNLIDSLALRQYNWINNLITSPFFKQSMDLRHFLIPVFFIIGLFCINKFKKTNQLNIYATFFSVTSLIFIFLVKQQLWPFGEIYNWLFYNLPLFNLYRVGSKFFILSAFSMSFFFALGVYYFYNFIKKYNKNLALVLTGFILFFSTYYNLEHFTDQKIGNMTKGVEIPKDYQILENKISKEQDYSRLVWFPQKHRFSYFSEKHPFLTAVYLLDDYNQRIEQINFNEWKARFDFLLKQPQLNIFLDFFAVKYVVVPPVEWMVEQKSISERSTELEIFRHYGGRGNPQIRDWYIAQLDKLDYLEKIDIGTESLIIYENKNYKAYISSLDKIYGLETANNLEYKYQQITERLKDGFAFAQIDKTKNIPTTDIYYLYENITPENIQQPNKINQTIKGLKTQTKLYTDQNKQNIAYVRKDPDQLIIYTQKQTDILPPFVKTAFPQF